MADETRENADSDEVRAGMRKRVATVAGAATGDRPSAS